jgi:pseudouridine-5'-phosphate glycosidase/pseudouridine kinase
MKAENLDTSGIVVGPTEVTREGTTQLLRTAQYVSVNDANKDLVLAMADMTIFENGVRSNLGADLPQRAPKWTVVDTNWNHATLRRMIEKARESGSNVAVEPVSVPKAARAFTPASVGYYSTPAGIAFHKTKIFPDNHIDLVTPNQQELAALHAAAKEQEFFETDRWWQIIDALGIPSHGARDRFVSITNHEMTDAGIPIQTIQLLPYIPTILTKLGADGVLHTELLKPNDSRLTDPASAPYILSRCTNGSTEVGGVYMRLFPAVKAVNNAVSVNGVGDTFLGVLIAGLAKGLKLDEDLINIAQMGAVMTLRSKEAVSPDVKLLSQRLNMVKNRKLNEDLLDAAGF